MYKAIARRKAQATFDALSRGDWQSAIADVAPDVHHVFPGDNAMGGERHSRDAMARWFERVYRLIPELEFEVKRIAVTGPISTKRVSRTSEAGRRRVTFHAEWLRSVWAGSSKSQCG